MNAIEILLCTLAAVVAAAIIDRWIVSIRRRLTDDADRSGAAVIAFREQEADLDALLVIDDVDKEIKEFIVDLCEASLKKRVAGAVVNLLRYGPPQPSKVETTNEVSNFFNRLMDLQKKNQHAFDIVTRLIRRSILLSVLQWPHATKAINQLALAMADNDAESTVRSVSFLRNAIGKSAMVGGLNHARA